MKMSLHLKRLIGSVSPAYRAFPENALLLCLCANAIPSAYAWPMPRDPEPATGIPIDASFAADYAAALSVNGAIHDGAIMACRSDRGYIVQGWSYRLLPPPLPRESEFNRGTAFHSCLAMSAVVGVDGVILCSRGEAILFGDGLIVERSAL